MAAHVCRQGGYKAATVSIMMFFLYIELLYIQLYHEAHVCRQGGYKYGTIMMFFLYIELFISTYMALYDTGRI